MSLVALIVFLPGGIVLLYGGRVSAIYNVVEVHPSRLCIRCSPDIFGYSRSPSVGRPRHVITRTMSMKFRWNFTHLLLHIIIRWQCQFVVIVLCVIFIQTVRIHVDSRRLVREISRVYLQRSLQRCRWGVSVLFIDTYLFDFRLEAGGGQTPQYFYIDPKQDIFIAQSRLTPSVRDVKMTYVGRDVRTASTTRQKYSLCEIQSAF